MYINRCRIKHNRYGTPNIVMYDMHVTRFSMYIHVHAKSAYYIHSWRMITHSQTPNAPLVTLVFLSVF